VRAAIITGAAGALGTALCAIFRESGFRVIGTDRVAPATPSALPASFVTADLAEACADEERIAGLGRRLRDELKGDELATLVHCAGLQIRAGVEATRLEDWRRTLDVNLTAPLFLTRELLPELERANGIVVNIGSVHARATKPAFVAYATSKTALEGLTRAIAVDLGGRVRVVCVHPAAIDTPMLRAGFAGKEDLLSELGRAHPLGRIANAEEIAHFVALLAGTGATCVTGSAFVLDGGVLSRLHDPE
jgi:NAD(P)-dependent dehydrogenase (short-subunit alcohol dehydrogenase family)